MDSDNGIPSPDWFYARIDGSPVLQITAANASGTHTYGGTQLGFDHYGWSGWKDRAFDMSPEPSLTINHSSSTLTVDFYAGGNGWQGGGDESWGIENLKVETNVVPLPSAIFLMAPGLAGLIGLRRKLQ